MLSMLFTSAVIGCMIPQKGGIGRCKTVYQKGEECEASPIIKQRQRFLRFRISFIII